MLRGPKPHTESHESQRVLGDDVSWDVFLSYNRQDKAIAEQLANCLEREAQLKVWLDGWRVLAGDKWQQKLESALRGSKTFVVCFGPGGLGEFQEDEMQAALRLYKRRKEFRIIPVLLPGSSVTTPAELPIFLSQFDCVEFNGGSDLCQQESFARLVGGIRGSRHEREEVSAGSVAIECPYRGLAAFDEDHADFFFGREALTQELIEAVRSTRFLPVVGISGSGKSSLVRAGLLPKLKKGGLPFSEHWIYLTLKPGAHPLEELAFQLTRVRQDADRLAATNKLLAQFESDERALHLNARLLLEGRHDHSRFFIFIDQFEEVFTLCESPTEQKQFINNLRYAVSEGRTTVVITMRSDFMRRAAVQGELDEMLSDREVNVSPMEEADIRRAVEEPARLASLQFEGGLVNRILSDVKRASCALPLLEDTLFQLCEKRRGNLMSLQEYEESGGVQGSLAKRADAIFEGLSERQKVIARHILLRLTQPGDGAEDTRRRASVSEFITRPDEQSDVEQVINILYDARLLIECPDVGEERQFDVAHEALIRDWPKLNAWIEAARDTIRVERRLTADAQQWKKWRGKRGEEDLLYGDLKLALTEEWRASHSQSLSLLEQEFLDTSAALKERARDAARKRRMAIRVGVLVALSLIGTAAVLLRQVERAKKSREIAQEVRSQIDLGERERDYRKVLSLAVEAADNSDTTEAKDALRRALVRNFHVDYLHPEVVVAATFSPDGKSILTVGRDNFVRIWDVVRSFNSSPVLIPSPRIQLLCPDSITDAVYSKDGRFVLTVGENHIAQVWDARTGIKLHDQIRHDKNFKATFSPDGTKVVTASYDHTVKMWDTVSGQLFRTLLHSGEVQHAEFSPNGKYLLTVDGEVRLWDANSYTLLRSLGEPSNFATFSPDGSAILIINTIKAITSWDVETGAQGTVDKEQERELTYSRQHYVDVSADGNSIVAVIDGRAHLQDVDRHNLPQYIKDSDVSVRVVSAKFSSDNNLILVVFNDRLSKSVRLYECDVCGSFEELLNRAKGRLGRY